MIKNFMLERISVTSPVFAMWNIFRLRFLDFPVFPICNLCDQRITNIHPTDNNQTIE